MDQILVKQRLVSIFGAERVRDDDQLLTELSEDMSEAPAARPSFVVEAMTTEEVQALLRLANELLLPITPRVAGTNLGGLAIPTAGGILLDLRRMNRILEVDEREMYAVIEPGVTFADMRRHLDEHHPSLRMGYPLSPPETSVVCNCLCQGLANLSLRYGSMDEWLNGVEAVLPSGEVVRTGSMAISKSAFAKVPLPDLTGLFVGFQGTTGVVTKAAVELYPEMPERWRGFILNHSLEGSYQVLRHLSRLEICDDLGGISWPAGKMLFGVQKPTVRDPEEPEFFIYMDVTGLDAEHLAFKRRLVGSVVDRARQDGFKVESPLDVSELVRLAPRFNQFASFPTRLSFLLDTPGGGLTWVGLYGPASAWESASRKGEAIMGRYGFPPTIVSRPMKGGHFCVLRFITVFDKRDTAEVERVRHSNRELATMALDEGFVPYKTPAWVVRELFKDRLDPGLGTLVGQIKHLLDPNHIMNPGKWEL